jgi:hypothetical protein
LARSLRPRTSFREGVSVDSLDRVGSGYELGLGTGERVTADSVVLAHRPVAGRTSLAGTAHPPRHQGEEGRRAAHRTAAPRPRHGVVVFHDEDAFLLPLPRAEALALQLHQSDLGRRPRPAHRQPLPVGPG